MEGLSLIFVIVAVILFALSALDNRGQNAGGRFRIDMTAAGLAFFALAFIV